MRRLLFPSSIWDDCRPILFPEDGGESFALALARPCPRSCGRVVYLVEHLFAPERCGYSARSAGGLTLTGDESSRFNLVSANAARTGRVPVHLHSHPSGADFFSGHDDEHERRLHDWLRENGQPFLWSLVWPRGGRPRARLWADGGHSPGGISAGLFSFDRAGNGGAPLGALDRQRAFGPGLRQAATDLTVGIVGVGGVGMQVCSQLARSGFSRFVLIDPDRLERSNLNRLPETSLRDLGRFKVALARRLIRRACRAVGTTPRVRALPHDIVTAPSRVRTALRRCDIVLALTDDNLSRIRCLEIAFQGGAQYLHAGVDVRLNEAGPIEGLFFEVVGAEDGRFCPVCLGRLDLAAASVENRRYVGGEVWDRAQREGYIKDVPAPSVMSLNALCAGALVLEIQRRVSGIGSRDFLQLDLYTARLIAAECVTLRSQEPCAFCGTQVSAN